jgi:hypothetical protein
MRDLKGNGSIIKRVDARTGAYPSERRLPPQHFLLSLSAAGPHFTLKSLQGAFYIPVSALRAPAVHAFLYIHTYT